MTYMPTKARKWLATGIASVVAASVLPFAFIAPASAATVTTVAISKPIRATSTLTGTDEIGNGTAGTALDDSQAVTFVMDDSIYDIAQTALGTTTANSNYSANGVPTRLYLQLTSKPSTTAKFKIQDESLVDGSHTTGTLLDPAGFELALNTWEYGMDDTATGVNDHLASFTYFDGMDGDVGRDDTAISFNFVVNEVGTYVVNYYIDINGNGTADSYDPVGTWTAVAYGTPALSASVSTLALTPSKEETVTLTLTGGSLGAAESYILTDDSRTATTFRTYANSGAGQWPRKTNAAHTAITFDDTATGIDDSAGWVFSAADAMTLSVVIIPNVNYGFAGGVEDTVYTGAVRAIRGTGLVTSTVSITLSASALVNAIDSITLTAPTTDIYSHVADDDSSAGAYDYRIKPNSNGNTISGTFQLSNTADYGKSATVAIYDTASPTAGTTAITTSSVVTSALGVGNFSFTLTSSRLDVAGDLVTIVVGSVSTAASSAATTPKRLKVTAETAALRANFKVNNAEVYSTGTSVSVSGRLIQAAGSAVTASVTVKDQYGALKSGYKLKAMTAGTASATGARNAGVMQVSAVSGANGVASVTYTDASTSTANLYDALTLYILDATDDTQGTFAQVFNIHFATATLSGLTINGMTNAAYTDAEYEPWVPFDGVADVYSSTYTGDDSDQLMKLDVFSNLGSTTVATQVVFTGSAGVRFASQGSGAVNAAQPNLATATATQHDEGKSIVYGSTSTSSGATLGQATAYFYCITTGPCTVTATQGASSLTATVTYGTPASAAMNVVDVKVNDVAATTGTSVTTNKVKVSFKVTDVFGNAVKTLGESGIGVDVLVSGVGSVDGLGSQGTLKTATNGTAQFYASSSAAGSMQIELDGSGADFGDAASTALAKPASADKKTVTITWTAAPVVVPEVVYAAPTLTVTKSGSKIILDGTAVEGEGDIIVYIKRVGTTKWVEQAATIEVAAPGDYNGMRIAPKSNVLIRVKQEGTGKFSNQVVVLK